MNIVLYNINDKYFNFEGNAFGAFIQSSEGLFSELKPKERTKYNWPEQNGEQISTKKPYFESREITLKGWIEGNDWLDIKSKFDSLFGEFRKPGKQRLGITPFGEKTLIYEVLNTNIIKFNKEFRKGEMIGFFSLELIENNPIKKVFKVAAGNFHLSFDVADQSVVEVNVGNNSILLNGPYEINQNLPNKTIQSGYVTENLIPNSGFKTRFGLIPEIPNPEIEVNTGDIIISVDGDSGTPDFFQVPVNLKPDTDYTLSYYVRGSGRLNSFIYPEVGAVLDDNYNPIDLDGSPNWRLVTQTFKTISVLTGQKHFLFRSTPDSSYQIKRLKLEKGNKVSDWSESPADYYYISVAGDVDQMSNFDTNADLIWERL